MGKLRIKSVYAFAFAGVEDDDSEPKIVVGHACSYDKSDKTIADFVAEHVARGNVVGVFTHSEWH